MGFKPRQAACQGWLAEPSCKCVRFSRMLIPSLRECTLDQKISKLFQTWVSWLNLKFATFQIKWHRIVCQLHGASDLCPRSRSCLCRKAPFSQVIQWKCKPGRNVRLKDLPHPPSLWGTRAS